MVRFRAAVAIALLAACSGGEDGPAGTGATGGDVIFDDVPPAPSDGAGGSGGVPASGGQPGGAGQGGTQPPEPTCEPNRPCICDAYRSGLTNCDSGTETCQCEPCAPQEFSDVPAFASCAGDTVGTWRLTRLEVGLGEIRLENSGLPVGTCDLMNQLTGTDTPRLLMDLRAGGLADYYSEEVPLMMSWSDECVVSKTPELGCESGAWSAPCALDCNTCVCDAILPATDFQYGTWGRTDEKLDLELWSTLESYDYCVDGNTLTISKLGMVATFERVAYLRTPTPCVDRDATTCEASEDCRLGRCVGSICNTTSESVCGTLSGCSWDVTGCRAFGSLLGCGLGDADVVPGCKLLDAATTCAGTVIPCSERPNDACADGCQLVNEAHCAGTTSLDCGYFDNCPTFACDFTDFVCSGATSCSAFTTQSDCSLVNEFQPGDPCAWDNQRCGGTATPCSAYSLEECASVTGCALAEAAP